MKVKQTPEIQINTMAVSTGWGNEGNWTIKFLEKPNRPLHIPTEFPPFLQPFEVCKVVSRYDGIPENFKVMTMDDVIEHKDECGKKMREYFFFSKVLLADGYATGGWSAWGHNMPHLLISGNFF